MPSIPSTALIALPDDFFGGVSPKGFTNPWTPNLWIDPGVTDKSRFTLGWTQPGTGTYVSLTADFTEQKSGRDELVRHFCHYILDQVSDEGLEEVGETLVSICKFYAERSQEQKLLQNHSSEEASFGKSYDRDPFYITGE